VSTCNTTEGGGAVSVILLYSWRMQSSLLEFAAFLGNARNYFTLSVATSAFVHHFRKSVKLCFDPLTNTVSVTVGSHCWMGSFTEPRLLSNISLCLTNPFIATKILCHCVYEHFQMTVPRARRSKHPSLYSQPARSQLCRLPAGFSGGGGTFEDTMLHLRLFHRHVEWRIK
jgi:hypothetical protein